MSACTFFGHGDCPDSITALLYQTVEKLYLEEGVCTFYVGNQGRFDSIVRNTLRCLQQQHPDIHYGVVLAYMPAETLSDTMLPEGQETIHPKFAIDRRNRWMLNRSDFVVTYIRRTWGGAYKYATLAERAGKRVIAL